MVLRRFDRTKIVILLALKLCEPVTSVFAAGRLLVLYLSFLSLVCIPILVRIFYCDLSIHLFTAAFFQLL